MKIFKPVYMRPPNKFLRYEERLFDDGSGHTAMLRVAIFNDKNNKEQEAVAQVIWDEK